MRLSRRALWIILPLAGLAAPFVYGLVFWGEYSTEQTAKRSFLVEEDFTKVRKILVRTEAAKQIITMGGSSEYIDQQWTAIGGELDPGRLLQMMIAPEWRIELHGALKVRTLDDYVGRLEIELEQDVEIEPDFLHSEVTLEKPKGRLEGYHMVTRFSRDESTGMSRIDLTLTQRILTRAPWFAHRVADRRVFESADRTLTRQETAIRKLIAENIDDVPLLPLR
jgi:hypothetical protein